MNSEGLTEISFYDERLILYYCTLYFVYFQCVSAMILAVQARSVTSTQGSVAVKLMSYYWTAVSVLWASTTSPLDRDAQVWNI